MPLENTKSRNGRAFNSVLGEDIDVTLTFINSQQQNMEFNR